MRLRYDGPDGQVNYEVGIRTEESALLEPGKVYDLPAELAHDLLETSAHWARVTDYSRLNKKQLQDVARAEGIAGYSTMSKDELLAAVRGATSADTSSADEPAPPPAESAERGDGGRARRGRSRDDRRRG